MDPETAEQPSSISEAKRLKSQVEHDVQLLRNRVRMLQQEHEKANKKIQDTSKKTEEIINRRMQNDLKYQ